jgi:hypothetical protein
MLLSRWSKRASCADKAAATSLARLNVTLKPTKGASQETGILEVAGATSAWGPKPDRV